MTLCPLASARPIYALVLTGAVLAAVAMAEPLPAQQVPADIAALYDEVRIATEMEDMEAIKTHLSSLARLQAAAGQGVLLSLNKLFEEQENLAVEVRFDDIAVVRDRAFALVTWALSGKTTQTQDPWNTTIQRADILVRRDRAWQFLASDEVDSGALAQVTNSIYEDPKTGLKVEAPARWRVVPLAGFKSFVMAVSPEADAWITWMASDLPGTFTAEQLCRAEQDIIEELGPTVGLEVRDTAMEPSQFAGRPAFTVRRTIVAADGIEARQQITTCIVGSTVYAGACAAAPPAAYETHKLEIARSLAATQITAPDVTELPVEAGRIEGRKYTNDTHGCEITAPEEWDIKIGQGNWRMQISMQPPQGDSFITVGMIDLPDPTVTAEQAVLSDDNITSRAFENYEVIRQGETKVGTLPAYESVTRFDFGDQTRQRWRIYLVDEERLFFMFADVVPVDAWDRLQDLLNETFQSFRLFEAQPETETP